PGLSGCRPRPVNGYSRPPVVDPVPGEHGPAARAGHMQVEEMGHVSTDGGLGNPQLPSDAGLNPVAPAISTEEPQDLPTTQYSLGPSHRVVAGTARSPSADLVPAGRGSPGLAHFDSPFCFRVSRPGAIKGVPSHRRL